MADVFISFASNDAQRVARIHARLIAHGFDVWWMRNLLPGESPIKTVSRELLAARNVLLAWSRSAEESPYVEGEIMHAFGARKLLPVRIEKWAWPAFLSSVQYVDMTPDDDELEAWRRIEARLQQTPQSAASTVAFSAVSRRLAVPRSAGPVGKMALATMLLALMLAAGLEGAYRALLDGDMQTLRLAQSFVLVLPVLAAVPVVIAGHRVWRAWRSRPTRFA
jgi:TIR domain